MILIQFLITVLCAWIGGKCIYNLFFHPLRSYPGPFLCRISSIPRLWHRLAGTSIHNAHLAHERYGAVVRLSPTELSYISSDAWNDIYAKHDGNAALPKEPAFNAAPPDAPRGLVQAIDGPPHARQRRVFAPAFSNSALKKQEALIRGHVRKLVAHLERACARGDAGTGTGTANVADLFNFTTFDVMADLAFGAPLGLLDAGAYSPWVRNVFAVFRLLSVRAVVALYLPWVYAFVMRRLSTRAVRERRRAHLNYGAELVDKRLDRAEGLEHPDIWSFVERKQDVLTRSEMHINAAVFMAAGTETTATALCGAVWYLTGNPEKMRKLVEEIRGEAGKGSTMETLARLPYLNAVITESLRLYPPTPDMMYRLVPEGGAMICGHHVPAGAVVGLHQWPAYHSPRNFNRPEEFIPERWLADAENGGEFSQDDKRVVQPFSRGPRSCIGRNLALHAIRLALAHVLWHFDLSLSEESTNWIEQKSFIVWEKPPLIVELTRAA